MTVTDDRQRSPAIDKERLRKKYIEERNKRLRAEGNDQSI
jgi:cyclohexanone monooxygenase